MYTTEEVSLSEFYRIGIELARDAGYTILITLIARTADAPTAYRTLVDAWDSFDDLTASKAMFLLAGPRAGQDTDPQTAYDTSRERLLFNSNATLLHSRVTGQKMPIKGVRYEAKGKFPLSELQRHTGAHRRSSSGIDGEEQYVLADYHPNRPKKKALAAAQTAQISQLCSVLSLNERDVPCLHLTFLDDMFQCHVGIDEKTDLYARTKHVMSALASEEFERIRSGMKGLEENRRARRKSLHDLSIVEPFDTIKRSFIVADSLLGDLSGLDRDQQNEVETLASALRHHVQTADDRSRVHALSAFASAKRRLGRCPEWGLAKAAVQRLIDLVMNVGPLELTSKDFIDDLVSASRVKADHSSRILSEIEVIESERAALIHELRSMLNCNFDNIANQSLTQSPRSPRSIPQKFLIITALPEEFAAVTAVCDKFTSFGVENDPTIYHVGSYVDKLRVERTVLIATQAAMGKVNAATLATNALRSFPSVLHVLMVGIAGGCPNPDKADEHVRLGDVVVSDSNGVFEYDNVKRSQDAVEHRGSAQKPSQKMLQALAILKAKQNFSERPWEQHIDAALGKLKGGEDDFNRPGDLTDILHRGEQTVEHPHDARRRANRPRIHGGAIGTGDTLLKDPVERDRLRDIFKLRAIEMEGSAVQTASWAHGKDAIVIRGISDYCDAHKNDRWRYSAALAAAAFARAMIETLPAEWFR